ncbi:hypothetical protein, partial [Marivirga sp.]|uniref:hypothetical protein n=1 Tax=Marivirga sp. TaxID=2018662 RepID=UPI0025CF767E
MATNKIASNILPQKVSALKIILKAFSFHLALVFVAVAQLPFIKVKTTTHFRVISVLEFCYNQELPIHGKNRYELIYFVV